MTELQQEKAREERLKSALEEFESTADAPVIPGELLLRLEQLAESLKSLKQQFVKQVDEGHVAAFRQIKDEDPEMFRRIEQMRTEDRELAGEFDDVGRRLGLLKSVAERVDQDEKRLEAALSEFVPRAQALVARIRKQEVAVRTWLMEAFNRDRGVAD